MENTTTNLDAYKNFKIEKEKVKKAKLPKEAPPKTAMSSY